MFYLTLKSTISFIFNFSCLMNILKILYEFTSFLSLVAFAPNCILNLKMWYKSTAEVSLEDLFNFAFPIFRSSY